MTLSILSVTSCPACPACNSVARSSYLRADLWQLFDCKACGLIYLDPMPGPDMRAAMYHDAYNGAKSGYFAKPQSKLRRSSARLRIIRRLARVGGGNFLDIGCSGGFMVEAARREGFSGWGIDLDAVSLEYASRRFPENHYFHGQIADFSPKNGRGEPVFFSVAYCSEVIEHVPHPQNLLRGIYRLLAPGGVLYLTTPDISHWRRPRQLAKWDGFSLPSHCLYFNPESLIALALRCGFELRNRRPAWKPGIKLLLQRPF